MNTASSALVVGLAQLVTVSAIVNASSADTLPDNPYHEPTDEATYKTTFTLKSALNGAVTTYPSDASISVVSPQNSAWTCEVAPVTLVKQGKRNAGFVCRTKMGEFIGIMANCASLHADSDRAYAKVGANNDDRQTMDFSVSCETRRSSTHEPGF